MTGADWGLILSGVMLNAVAQLLLKAGAAAITGLSFSLAHAGELAQRMALNPPILAGLACYAVSVVVWIMALSRVEVSVAYPMLSIGYIVNALAAWMLFSEEMTAGKLAGIGVIILGVWMVARS